MKRTSPKRTHETNRLYASRWRAAEAAAGVFLAAMVLTAGAGEKEPAKAAGKPMMSVSPDDPSLKWGPCPEIFAKGCEVAVLTGDTKKGPSDVYLRTPKNYDMPSHWHTSPEHIVVVKGKFSATFEGGKQATGTYTYIPSKMPHSARCDDTGPCVIFIGFERPVDAILTKKK
jgi:anti-sigma factor ChrR (cupin superfamily)